MDGYETPLRINIGYAGTEGNRTGAIDMTDL